MQFSLIIRFWPAFRMDRANLKQFIVFHFHVQYRFSHIARDVRPSTFDVWASQYVKGYNPNS